MVARKNENLRPIDLKPMELTSHVEVWMILRSRNKNASWAYVFAK